MDRQPPIVTVDGIEILDPIVYDLSEGSVTASDPRSLGREIPDGLRWEAYVASVPMVKYYGKIEFFAPDDTAHSRPLTTDELQALLRPQWQLEPPEPALFCLDYDPEC